MGVVPIVNENDTISVSVRPISLHSWSLDSVCLVTLTESRNVQEIKFGDNDTLSAITSSMVHADYLFLLTDVDGLYLSNPRKDPDAKFLEAVSSVAEARLEGREPANSSLHHPPPSSIYSRSLFHRPRFTQLSTRFSPSPLRYPAR